MTELRYFNSAGRGRWAQYLSELKVDSKRPFPDGLISSPDFTILCPGHIRISWQSFDSKFELAKSTATIIVEVRKARLPAENWAGLWDWIAALRFDSLCPQSVDGSRKVKASALYAFESSWRRKYRHRIYGPAGLYERLGESSRILIHGAPWSLTDWEEQAASRYEIASNPGIAEALYRLYWDSERAAPKRGAAANTKRPGTLRRFSDIMLQLARTYDLLSIDARGIASLLPKEFEKYQTDGT